MCKKIKEIGFFRTPKDWDELQKWIEAHSVEERAHLWTGAMMAWNLAAKIVSEEE